MAGTFPLPAASVRLARRLRPVPFCRIGFQRTPMSKGVTIAHQKGIMMSIIC
jgi:hypothetical protein